MILEIISWFIQRIFKWKLYEEESWRMKGLVDFFSIFLGMREDFGKL